MRFEREGERKREGDLEGVSVRASERFPFFSLSLSSPPLRVCNSVSIFLFFYIYIYNEARRCVSVFQEEHCWLF